MLLDREDCFLLIIDIQERLAPAVSRSGQVTSNARRLVQAAVRLDIPVLMTAHCPDKIGPVLPALTDLVPDDAILPKVHFAAQREAGCAARFAELGNPTAMRRRILSNWDAKFGRLNPLVHWERLSPELLERALQRIPPSHWHCLFQRLLDDLQHHRSGLPDLILFPREGHYRLIEIKAPGDRLQKNQQRWMRFFADHDIPHQVSHITWLTT